MTALKDIKNRFPGNKVERIDTRQAFYVYCGTQHMLALSYNTIVGCYCYGTFYLTTDKYSVTTTKQCNRMAKDFHTVERVSEEMLQKIVADSISF